VLCCAVREGGMEGKGERREGGGEVEHEIRERLATAATTTTSVLPSSCRHSSNAYDCLQSGRGRVHHESRHSLISTSSSYQRETFCASLAYNTCA